MSPPIVLVSATLVAFVAGCAPSDRSSAVAGGDTVRVAVAANFATVHDTLAQLFQRTTAITVVTTVGSTGQLYAQIVNGLPVDVFLSADQERPAELERDGVAVHGSRFTYAVGRLAIYAPYREVLLDSPAKLAAAEIRHIAIANPATAPYGAAAMDVLSRWGITARVNARLVRGESIAQTLQFVESGAAEAGFIALSQAIGLARDKYWTVPDSLHARIAQDAVVLARSRGNPAVPRYVAFLRSDETRRVIESFGYAAGDTSRAMVVNERH